MVDGIVYLLSKSIFKLFFYHQREREAEEKNRMRYDHLISHPNLIIDQFSSLEESVRDVTELLLSPPSSPLLSHLIHLLPILNPHTIPPILALTYHLSSSTISSSVSSSTIINKKQQQTNQQLVESLISTISSPNLSPKIIPLIISLISHLSSSSSSSFYHHHQPTYHFRFIS